MGNLLTFFIAFVAALNVFASEAQFDVNLIPAGDFTGKTSDIKGFAIVSGNKIMASNIRVALSRVKTGIELRDQHTKRHLQVDKFPEAILVRGQGVNGKGSGILKIKGIEKKVNGTYKLSGNAVLAEFKIKLSDFNITGIKYMGVGVDDEVVLRVKVPAKKASAAKSAGVR